MYIHFFYKFSYKFVYVQFLSDLHDRYETPSVYLKHFFIMEERKRPNKNVRKES